MSHYYISTKNLDGSYSSHEVPREVYTYIRQLETFIKNPVDSGLLDLYSERFPSKSEWIKKVLNSKPSY